MEHRNPWRDALRGLDEAEGAWFDDKGLESYALWAKWNTGLLRGTLAMIADDIDRARNAETAPAAGYSNSQPEGA